MAPLSFFVAIRREGKTENLPLKKCSDRNKVNLGCAAWGDNRLKLAALGNFWSTTSNRENVPKLGFDQLKWESIHSNTQKKNQNKKWSAVRKSRVVRKCQASENFLKPQNFQQNVEKVLTTSMTTASMTTATTTTTTMTTTTTTTTTATTTGDSLTAAAATNFRETVQKLFQSRPDVKD